MKTFLFNIAFVCPYTNEFKTENSLEYRANDQQTAIKGMLDYCNTNKNRLKCKAVLIGELSFTGSPIINQVTPIN